MSYGENVKFDPSAEIENEKAHAIIREIVAGGEIIISNHAKERMKERGYTAQDVEYILLQGEITSKEFKDKTQSWAYKIQGEDLEGDEGGVVTAIINRLACVIITVLS